MTQFCIDSNNSINGFVINDVDVLGIVVELENKEAIQLGLAI